MAYFLKVAKQYNCTYSSIFKSLCSLDIKSTEHRGFKKLGNLNSLIASKARHHLNYFI